MKMKYIFNSERLGFREWENSDSLPFSRMNLDPEVMEFFPSTLTKVESDIFVEKIKIMFAEYNYGLYAVDRLDSNEFIGFIGFWHPNFESELTPCIEIGWRIKKQDWNNGFATEGASRCLKFGFENLNFSEVVSLTSKINLKSESVMKKIGMNRFGEFEHPNIDDKSLLKKHIIYKAKNTAHNNGSRCTTPPNRSE